MPSWGCRGLSGQPQGCVHAHRYAGRGVDLLSRSGRTWVWGWGMSLGSSSHPTAVQNLLEPRVNGLSLIRPSGLLCPTPDKSFEK